MNKYFRENYFLLMRLCISIFIVIFVEAEFDLLAGTSYREFLLLALFIVMVTMTDFLTNKRKVAVCFLLEVLVAFIFYTRHDHRFSLLFAVVILEGIGLLDGVFESYFLTYLALVVTPKKEIFMYFVVISLIAIIYLQNNRIIGMYRKHLQEDTVNEQRMKKSIDQSKKMNLLFSENRVLEERSRISQELHDKLGHSINGSVYQLEACKILLDQNPKESIKIIEAVIKTLRTSMDEIRIILRKERPSKRMFTMLQLQQFCEECKEKYHIDARIKVVGDKNEIADRLWKVILDNTMEAVSNALKYAKCTRIEIDIVVMNQFIRCTIRDNGKGCAEIKEGMGLAGMKERVKNMNGIFNVESEAGFTITMIFPKEE